MTAHRYTGELLPVVCAFLSHPAVLLSLRSAGRTSGTFSVCRTTVHQYKNIFSFFIFCQIHIFPRNIFEDGSILHGTVFKSVGISA